MQEFTSWLTENITAASVLTVFIGLMITSAWRASRRHENKPGPVIIALSFFSTFLSTNTFLGQSGFGYKVGLVWLLAGLVFLLCAILAWFVVAKRMIGDARTVLGEDLDLDRITIPAYLRLKFGGVAIGYLSAIVVFFASVLYMLAVFKGIGHIVSRIINVSYETAVIGVCVIVVAYTSWGMIRAILHTDAVQGGIMLLGVITLFASCVIHVDWSALAVNADFDASGEPLGSRLFSWSELMAPLAITGLSLSTGIKMMVAPRLVVRFLLFRHASTLEIRQAKWLAVGLLGLTLPMLFSLGILAHGIIPQGESQFFFQNTDQVIPYLVSQLFGSFWGAVLLGSFLCAALSSIDSVLHVAGSALVIDGWAEWHGSASSVLVDKLQRIVMIPVAILPAALALNPPADVVPLTALSGALFGGCFLPALVLSLWWKQKNRRAAVWSIIAGAAAVVLWSAGLAAALDLSYIHPVFAGLVVSLSVYVCTPARKLGLFSNRP